MPIDFSGGNEIAATEIRSIPGQFLPELGEFGSENRYQPITLLSRIMLQKPSNPTYTYFQIPWYNRAPVNPSNPDGFDHEADCYNPAQIMLILSYLPPLNERTAYE